MSEMREIAFEIGETSRVMRRFYDRQVAALGVTSAQWKVMAWLGRMPGLKQVELAERLDVEPITACRIVDRLEESELVERRRDPDDRRAWRLYLTDKAQPLVTKLRTMGEGLAEEAFAGFSEQDTAALHDLLARIRDNVGRIEAAQKETA